MTLAAWTICPTCCEAHLARNACPRCLASAPRQASARLPVPPRPEAPAPRQAPQPPIVRSPPPSRAATNGIPLRTSIGGLLTLALILCGVVLLSLHVARLGVAFCIVPVGVQGFLRVREKRAERQALTDLGLRLHS